MKRNSQQQQTFGFPNERRESPPADVGRAAVEGRTDASASPDVKEYRARRVLFDLLTSPR